MATDCNDSDKPDGYDLDDVKSTMLGNDFVDKLGNDCRTDQGRHVDANACDKALTEADNKLSNLFWTSDVDLRRIYNTLFGCPSFQGTPMVETITSNVGSLKFLNSTIYGSGTEPGLLNDLLSLTDGIEQIRVVAEGQSRSLDRSGSSQVIASRTLQTQLAKSAESILSKTGEIMRALVGNRTIAQKQAFKSIADAVKVATADTEQQAIGIYAMAQAQFETLKERYADWVDATELKIDEVTESAAANLNSMNIVGQGLKEILKNTRTAEFANIALEVEKMRSSWSADFADAATDVFNGIGGLGMDLAKGIMSNKGQLLKQLSTVERAIEDRKSNFRTQIASGLAASKVDAKDSKDRGAAALEKLHALMRTSVRPLMADLQSGMQQIVHLSAAIEEIRKTTNSDMEAIKSKSIQSASNLDETISNTYSEKKSGFSKNFNDIRSTMNEKVSARIKAGRDEISKIMSGVKLGQESTANQQALQGQTAEDQAEASKTAAAMVAARQQSAADNAKAGLDTMVGVVGSALRDAQETIQEVSESNAENIRQLSTDITASEQQSMGEAYEKVRSSNDASADRSHQAREEGFEAEQEGQDLEQEISESGQKLEGSVAYQNRRSKALLADIQDMMNLVRQNSGTLTEQMKAFEKQAPAMYEVLKQKIAAYKATLVSQGQQTQLNAAGSAAAQAQTALGKLVGGLDIFGTETMETSPDLAWGETRVRTDATAVIADLTELGAGLEKQTEAGASMVTNTAQKALTRTVTEIKTVSQDSAAALTALLGYNTALISQKRAEVLRTGTGTIESAMSASEHLIKNAKNFMDLSEKYLSDSENLGGQATQNLTSMVRNINRTLADLTASSDQYLDRVSKAAASVAGWSASMVAGASAVNAQVQAKAAEVTKSIMSELDPLSETGQSLAKTLRSMRSFVSDMMAAFNKQRVAFLEMAKTYSARRIELMVALNETITAMQTAFRSELTKADITEGKRAGSSSDTLQGLLTSLETAKAQGTADMKQLSALMGKIGESMAGLTNSFTAKMGVDLEALRRRSTRDAISSDLNMHGTVGKTSVSANLLAGQLARAIEDISGSELAAEMAAGGAEKDVYSIAGLLKNAGKETQGKIASLLREIEAGSLTFDEALNAAKEVSKKDIASVMDVIDVFDRYVTSHLAEVYHFNASVAESVNALNITASNAIGDHVAVNGEALAAMTVSQFKLGNLSSVWLPDPATNYTGIIAQIKDTRNKTINDIEDSMNLSMHGSPPSGALIQVTTRKVPIALVQVVPENATVADSLAQANIDVSRAAVQITSSRELMNEVLARSIAQANAVVANILNITQYAMKQ
jgi:hypothetical protein